MDSSIVFSYRFSWSAAVVYTFAMRAAALIANSFILVVLSCSFRAGTVSVSAGWASVVDALVAGA